MSPPDQGEGGADRTGSEPDVDVALPPESESPPRAEPGPRPPAAPSTGPAPKLAGAPAAAPVEPAMVAAPAKRPKEQRPLALANLALGRSEIAFLAILAVGEALAFAQFLVGHVPRTAVTAARIGGLYVFGSLHVPIQLRATASGVRGTYLDFSVALLTITAVGVVLLFRGGETVGDRAAGGLLRRGLWGAAVGVPFGLFAFLLSLLVRIHFQIPVIEGGEVAVGVSRPWALFLPLAVGLVVGLLGGVWSGLSRARATAPRSAGAKPWPARTVIASGAFAGAWRMFVAGLGLAFVGLLVLAGLHPDATRRYIDATAGSGAGGIDRMAHHVLALPNQSMLVLVPAMGGCDIVQGTAEPTTFLCYSTFPERGSVNLTAPFFRGRRGVLASPFQDVRFGDAPGEMKLFLLVPLLAGVLGGLRAAKPAGRRAQAAAAGALAGVGFAALVVAGCFAAGLSVRFYGGRAPASLTVLPDPVAGGLLGLGWGVVVGGVSAFLGWRPAVRKAPPAAPAGAAMTANEQASPATAPPASTPPVTGPPASSPPVTEPPASSPPG